MYRSIWGTVILLQISVAELDSLEVFSILLTAEDDSLLYPEFIFLNVSGLVLTRHGGPATLHCSVRLLGGSAQSRYRVRWATGPPGGLPVAQVDQGKEPWVKPSYRGRVTLRSHGPENYLHFSRVTAADFGKYTVTVQVASSSGEPFTFITMLAEAVAPSVLECTPMPHIVVLNTSATVSGLLGGQVTLHCRVVTAPACPDTRYRLRWEALGTGWDQKRTLILAQEDQASGEPPHLHASYHNRLNMSSRGPETQLRISKLRRDDPKKYRCIAGIAGADGEVSSRTIHLRKLGRKEWNRHTQTAILMLSINVLLFFVIMISFRISILSQPKGQKPAGIVSESHRKMKIFGV